MLLLVIFDRLLIKRLRLHSNPNYFILENDKKEHEEEQKILKSEIRQVLVLRGKLSSTLNSPHHQLALKGKIKAMEEAIEFFNRKLLW